MGKKFRSDALKCSFIGPRKVRQYAMKASMISICISSINAMYGDVEWMGMMILVLTVVEEVVALFLFLRLRRCIFVAVFVM